MAAEIGLGHVVLDDGSLITIPARGVSSVRHTDRTGAIVEHPFAADTDDGPVYLHPTWRLFVSTQAILSGLRINARVVDAARLDARKMASAIYGEPITLVGVRVFKSRRNAKIACFIAVPLVAFVRGRLLQAAGR